jgi:hypothetical protein
MKVTNWRRKLCAALAAAGIWVPGMAFAAIIPLGDPSFEDYVVPSRGYAFAADPGGAYRVSPPPLSAWIDDLDSPPDGSGGPSANYLQDDANSNWLYNAAYAESGVSTKRPSPRTGNQAMHGYANYSAQETSAVFEANRTYTFSIWAQNDEMLNDTNGLFLYIFDGTLPFSSANALEEILFAGPVIPQRTAGMTAAQSQANWAQFSVSHFVAAGAPEIGHTVGVAFFAFQDTAVDDASLSVLPDPPTGVIPEPAMIVIWLGLGGVSLAGHRKRE